MLNRKETRDRARQILPLLTGLRGIEAFQVLAGVGELIARRSAMAGEPELLEPITEPGRGLLRDRRRGYMSKIEKMPALKKFIHSSLLSDFTYMQITDLCNKQFGQGTISKSSVHRYIADLRKRSQA